MALLYVVRLDKIFSETPATDKIVFRVIGAYIVIAYVWPKQATKIVNNLLDKYILWQKDKEESRE